MISLYTLFKFLHIVSAIIWIGSVITFSLLNFRLSRAGQSQALQALSSVSNFYSRVVVAPAAALTLVAGIATAVQMGVSFSSLWTTWGFIGIFLSLILGTTFTRITTNKLSQLAMTGDIGQSGIMQNRLMLLNMIDVLLLLSVVAAMVFKPVL